MWSAYCEELVFIMKCESIKFNAEENKSSNLKEVQGDIISSTGNAVKYIYEIRHGKLGGQWEYSKYS